MSRFDKYIVDLLKNEGGYNNIPQDKGGETNFGIADNRDGVKDGMADLDGDKKGDIAIKNLTVEQAKAIYRKDYWNELYDSLTDERLSFKLFDVGVNLGVRQAVRILQRSELLKLKDDGNFGPKTLDACNKAGNTLYDAYVKSLEKYYIELVERTPSNKIFLRGWLNRLHRTLT